MSRTEKIVVILLIILLFFIIGGAIVVDLESQKMEKTRMIECFEKFDDPTWCWENLK